MADADEVGISRTRGRGGHKRGDHGQAAVAMPAALRSSGTDPVGHVEPDSAGKQSPPQRRIGTRTVALHHHLRSLAWAAPSLSSRLSSSAMSSSDKTKSKMAGTRRRLPPSTAPPGCLAASPRSGGIGIAAPIAVGWGSAAGRAGPLAAGSAWSCRCFERGGPRHLLVRPRAS
jgi:hypothetical protein